MLYLLSAARHRGSISSSEWWPVHLWQSIPTLALTNSPLQQLLGELSASKWPPEKHSWEQHEQFPSPAISNVIIVVPYTLGFFEGNSQSPAERSLQEERDYPQNPRLEGTWNSSKLSMLATLRVRSNSIGAAESGSTSSASSSNFEIPRSDSTLFPLPELLLVWGARFLLEVGACPLPKRDSTGDGPSVTQVSQALAVQPTHGPGFTVEHLQPLGPTPTCVVVTPELAPRKGASSSEELTRVRSWWMARPAPSLRTLCLRQ